MVKAEYISCTKNIFGDIIEIEIRDVKTGKHVHVTPEQIAVAVQKKLIEIKYIKVSSDGRVHITKKNKLTIADKIKMLESEIQRLEKSPLLSDKDKAIKKRQLKEKLLDEDYKFKKYVASDYEEK